tara:strand:- start:421 stop:1032 length:612 start_codon:yes stop_codon:yes gene_type:complete
MASNINTTTIDDTYPVPGQDNDSQGFRDNFQNIKTALGVAKTEITNLQNSSPQLTANNNFNGNTITDAVLQDVTFKAPPATTITAITDTIDFSNGGYQRIILSQEKTDVNDITFSNFGATDTLSHIRLEISNNNTNAKDMRITLSGGQVYRKQSTPGSATALTFPFEIEGNTSTRYIFDVWGYNTSGGVPSTIFVEYQGKYSV